MNKGHVDRLHIAYEDVSIFVSFCIDSAMVQVEEGHLSPGDSS